METRDDLILVMNQMPDSFYNGQKNKWTHDVRFYGATHHVTASRVYAEVPNAQQGPKHPYYDGFPKSLVGFVDYYIESHHLFGRVMHIGYASTRDDFRNQGIATRMLERIIEVEAPEQIEWGKVMSDHMAKIVTKMRTKYPQIKQYAKIR